MIRLMLSSWILLFGVSAVAGPCSGLLATDVRNFALELGADQMQGKVWVGAWTPKLGEPVLKQNWSDQTGEFYLVSVPLNANRGSGMSNSYQPYEFVIRKDLVTAVLTDESGKVSAPVAPPAAPPAAPTRWRGQSQQFAKGIADAEIQSSIWVGGWTPFSGPPQLMEKRTGIDSATATVADFFVYNVPLVFPMESGMTWPAPITVIVKEVSGVLTAISDEDADFQAARPVP